jgi:hypothetical protein
LLEFTPMRKWSGRVLIAVIAAAGALIVHPDAKADPALPRNLASAAVTYADLVDLADSAPLVIQAQVRKLVPLEAARATGLRPGWGRFYIEAKTVALLSGEGVISESLRYLADLKLDARGKPPALKKSQVLLFARSAPGLPGSLQLVAPDAQIPWTAASEAQLRMILPELLASDAPPRITGIREAIHVPGTLAGEGMTQFFLATPNDSAAAITVTRQPGQRPVWGVSFSEALESGIPPVRETLRWYRLACFLPGSLPVASQLSETRQDKAMAENDYRLVKTELGACPRSR